MIDIKFLRENPEAVKENIRKKFQMNKVDLVDEVIELDRKARELIDIKGDEEIVFNSKLEFINSLYESSNHELA